MPNIEIHGVRCPDKYSQLRAEIFQFSKKLLFAGEIVITVVIDECTNREGNPESFLRIISPHQTEIEQVAKCLKPLALDMELLLLTKFIPGTK